MLKHIQQHGRWTDGVHCLATLFPLLALLPGVALLAYHHARFRVTLLICSPSGCRGIHHLPIQYGVALQPAALTELRCADLPCPGPCRMVVLLCMQRVCLPANPA
jgi:hypothetical protein